MAAQRRSRSGGQNTHRAGARPRLPCSRDRGWRRLPRWLTTSPTIQRRSACSS